MTRSGWGLGAGHLWYSNSIDFAISGDAGKSLERSLGIP
jgi:hypothetical protein